MKHLKLILLVFFAGALFFGCKKYNDALPTVQFTSVTPFGNDSAILKGTVVSKGGDDIQYVGFSYNSAPTASILPNQVLLNGTNGAFSCHVMLPQDSTYYFKCFAANSTGYGISSAVKYTVPTLTLDSAHCTLTHNVIVDNNFSWTMAYIYTGPSYAPEGAFGIQASDASTTETINIQFKTYPLVNGIYTTEYAPFPSDVNPYEVNIWVQAGLYTTYTINAGGTVYVTKYPNGTTTVSFCSLTYNFASSNYPIYGKISF
jgi:hypothetical protein